MKPFKRQPAIQDSSPLPEQDWLSRFERIEVWFFVGGVVGFIGFGVMAAAMPWPRWAPLAIVLAAAAFSCWLLVGVSMFLMAAVDVRRYIRKRRANKFTPARVLYDNVKIGLSAILFTAFLISVVHHQPGSQAPKPQIVRTPAQVAVATTVSLVLLGILATASWWICVNARLVTQWFSYTVTPAEVRARTIRWAVIGTAWSLLLLYELLDASGRLK